MNISDRLEKYVAIKCLDERLKVIDAISRDLARMSSETPDSAPWRLVAPKIEMSLRSLLQVYLQEAIETGVVDKVSGQEIQASISRENGQFPTTTVEA